MTAITTKPEQKRLDTRVLHTPKWDKINEGLEKRACGTLKINDLIANAAVRVENAHQNGQTRHNATLLGKNRLEEGGERLGFRQDQLQSFILRGIIEAIWVTVIYEFDKSRTKKY